MLHNEPEPLTEVHHAVLFALLARQALAFYGAESGQALIRKWVRRYGEQRGRRMALRAMRDSKNLAMSDFLAYGEWRSATGSALQEMIEQGGEIRLRVFRCPWALAWEQSDFLDVGRLYCQEIDAALVRGFNPELRLQINSTLTNGGEWCEFIFYEAASLCRGAVEEVKRRQVEMRNRASLPWEYHCAHLYQSFLETMQAVISATGQQAAQAAAEAFSRFFGPGCLAAFQHYLMGDFDHLPG